MTEFWKLDGRSYATVDRINYTNYTKSNFHDILKALVLNFRRQNNDNYFYENNQQGVVIRKLIFYSTITEF